jgi:uncharacterized protein involved in exopolysaccharide biosynthesis
LFTYALKDITKPPHRQQPAPVARLEIDFRQLYLALRKRVWLRLACAILPLLLAGAYLQSGPRICQVQTVMEVLEDENSVRYQGRQ